MESKEVEIKNGNYLGKERITVLLRKFSVPSVLSMLVAALYNIVDQIFIGQGVGYLGNSATNVVYPFTVFALALALMAGDGISSLFSLYQGKGDEKEKERCIGNGILLILVFALFVTLLGFFAEEPLLWFFGASANCYQYAKDYFDVILIGMPAYIITSALAGLIRADGSPRYSMFATCLGAVINLILDPIAILYMNLGTFGAGITTIIGQYASLIMTLLYFIHPKTFAFHKSSFRVSWRSIVGILRQGISSFIIQISIVIVISVANKLINIYGTNSIYGVDIPLAVIGIVMKVFGIVIAIGVGIAVGGQPIIGFNYGAKNYQRVKETIFWILGLNLGVGLVATVIFEACPQVIIDLFGKDQGETYNAYAVLCFRIYLSGIALTCFQKAGSIILQSLGKPVQSMILSISRDVVFFVPCLIILAQQSGIEGMLYAALISDVLSSILGLFFLLNEFIQMKKLIRISKKEAVAS
ncbi:MAG: MATE family efflux transporter [Bacilli bacterium]|jgi:putative MATE family efflux protein|nr:MATE family efflux transporter [Bacilli bacterium]